MKDTPEVLAEEMTAKDVSADSPLSVINSRIKVALRGEIRPVDVAREVLWRSKCRFRRRRERRIIEALADQTARLHPKFASLSPPALLRDFRDRKQPIFFPGFEAQETTAALQQELFPEETRLLVESANRIVKEHCWQLLGLGEVHFGKILNWRRDPLSGREWPLDFHAEIKLWRNDGSDIRTLWELNRLGHFLTLARAYAVTRDEQFAEEFFSQIASWRNQNPVGHGANWSSAMEVALRAQNLIGSLALFRSSACLKEDRLLTLLTMLEQHGAHIERNLEFSYLATSNHYLCGIAGLLWIGLYVPQLEAATRWHEWAFKELLHEMDKQVLGDGAHYEASTGYHRLVVEQCLYSLVLCRANGLEVPEGYWKKLKSMLGYIRGYLRSDGMAPLIGDSDAGQVMPLRHRTADDHAYVVAIGAADFSETALKESGASKPEELLWILGEKGIDTFDSLTGNSNLHSQAFLDVGVYVLRNDDLYLLLTASGPGLKGRGSHRHNDVLSIEVSACGRPFIVDPGTYVYTAELRERHLFRSTAYHSTIQIDDVEQNKIDESRPFVIGNEAQPRLSDWRTDQDLDRVIAEHYGYLRLPEPATHRRMVTFAKGERYWFIEDEILGSGEHAVTARFHFAAGLEVQFYAGNCVVATDQTTGARLFVCPDKSDLEGRLEHLFTSNDYGARVGSVSVGWSIHAKLPCKLSWTLIPVCSGEDEDERLKLRVIES